MEKTCPVVFAEYDDIYSNLALEEILLTAPDTSLPMVIFSTNSDAVVVGKHQNPWAETNPVDLSRLDIALARRISGGGAVYHDRGNLNYSYILSKEGYHQPDVHAVVVKALKELGLAATVRNKSSIFVGEQKVSGSAFCYKRERVLHHGTLLVDVDLDRLGAVLDAYVAGIEGPGINSVPAPVANLKELKPKVDARQCADLIAGSFCETFGLQPLEMTRDEAADSATVLELREARKSDDWIYGNTPKFKLQWQFEGCDPVLMAFEKGRLIEVNNADGNSQVRPEIQKLIGLRLDEIFSNTHHLNLSV